jgi:hypothetical protein
MTLIGNCRFFIPMLFCRKDTVACTATNTSPDSYQFDLSRLFDQEIRRDRLQWLHVSIRPCWPSTVQHRWRRAGHDDSHYSVGREILFLCHMTCNIAPGLSLYQPSRSRSRQTIFISDVQKPIQCNVAGFTKGL